MSTTKLLLVLCCVLILAPAAVGATDPWLTDVMPRLADFVEWHLQVGGDAPPAPEGFADKLPGVADSVYDVQWPVTVKKTEGDWLWIVDEGGYSVPPAHGWVRKDAMLKLTDKDGIVDSYAYYMTELRKYNDPHHAPSWVHWLLGITLEKSKKDTKNAQMEYWRALGLSAGPETLDNAEEALDRAYQALGEARRRLESDTNMAAAPNPVPLLQTVRERLIEGRGFLRTAIALRQAHQPPAWTIIPLRRAPAVPPAGIVIAPAMRPGMGRFATGADHRGRGRCECGGEQPQLAGCRGQAGAAPGVGPRQHDGKYCPGGSGAA
jgi:hypothetical protein